MPCKVCKKPATDCCSVCKTVYYCGHGCQVADWKGHKKVRVVHPPIELFSAAALCFVRGSFSAAVLCFVRGSFSAAVLCFVRGSFSAAALCFVRGSFSAAALCFVRGVSGWLLTPKRCHEVCFRMRINSGPLRSRLLSVGGFFPAEPDFSCAELQEGVRHAGG
jgi:hypothetical protein